MILRTLRGAEALAHSLAAARTRPDRAAWVACTAAAVAGVRFAEPAARALAAPWNPAAAVASIEQQRVPRTPSLLGVGAFALGQVVYAARLLRLGVRPDVPVALACAAATAVGAYSARGTGLSPAALVGGAASTVTTALANDPALRNGAPASEGISHGANLGFAAEGLRLAANAAPRRPRARLLAALCAATGLVGQLLLADGLRG
ncbi:hypothetical protein [Corynebacterium auris]|uniref:hypothetical protein n=1 Tax=Corynebacterium auris TaxID=44750 RepID=UPI0025B295A4|nr:hypothetical protein [Corynebacterium auris]WJY67148.1 hypothetical protein CAURIS_01040 [Corynebacterium auris]